MKSDKLRASSTGLGQPLFLDGPYTYVGRMRLLERVSLTISEREYDTLPTIRDTGMAVAFVEPYLRHLAFERIIAVMLDPQLKVLGAVELGKGGHSGVMLDALALIRAAADTLASGFLLAHNHPIGIAQPSDADVMLTRQVRQIGVLLSVPLVDHLILSRTSAYSFTDDHHPVMAEALPISPEGAMAYRMTRPRPQPQPQPRPQQSSQRRR